MKKVLFCISFFCNYNCFQTSLKTFFVVLAEKYVDLSNLDEVLLNILHVHTT